MWVIDAVTGPADMSSRAARSPTPGLGGKAALAMPPRPGERPRESRTDEGRPLRGLRPELLELQRAGLFNAYHERPATIELAGDVHGRRVLDAGGGSGPLSGALRARGAIVAGFDSSAAMIELARQRLGADADLQVADIGKPLPFADGAFDVVVVSLVQHYLQDRTAPLSGLRRVLKPGGRLLLSVNHPRIARVERPRCRRPLRHAVLGRVHLRRRSKRSPHLLAPALARHDRRVHRGWLPHRGHH